MAVVWAVVATLLVLVSQSASSPTNKECLHKRQKRQDPIEKSLDWEEADVEVLLTPGMQHSHSSHSEIHHTRDSNGTSFLRVSMEDKDYHLSLTPTSWLVSENASVSYFGNGNPGAKDGFFQEPLLQRPCLYFVGDHSDATAPTGSLSLCHDDGPRVILLEGPEITELLPHPGPSPRIPVPPGHIVDKKSSQRRSHIVKRYTLPAIDDLHNHICPDGGDCTARRSESAQHIKNKVKKDGQHSAPTKRVTKTYSHPLTVELGLFLDKALIDLFADFLGSEEPLVDIVIGLINNVQALYNHRSLGRQVRFIITHLRLLKVQPDDLPIHNADRIKLLKAFCSYNQRHNGPDDNAADHWDIGVYLSGLNFVSETPEGVTSGVTMGLAYTGGVCQLAQACVISEMGATNWRGKPYPSAGALASYVLAHEIGHSLGLRHDGVSNNCERTGYLMAAGRGLRGATTWSTCARKKLTELDGSCLKEASAMAVSTGPDGVSRDHTIYGGMPGQVWDAQEQCRLFLRDDDAQLEDITRMHEVCDSVSCASPHRIATYLAGPALEGTYCGDKNWCKGGSCVPWRADRPAHVAPGGMSNWIPEPCQSACVIDGTGWQYSRRNCNSPPPQNSDSGCMSGQLKVNLCPDHKVCGITPRRTVSELVSDLCREVASHKNGILAEGSQLTYDSAAAWKSCALYCRKKDSNSLWTPRYEFQDMPSIPTHLPDGTPCHEHNDEIYVCLNHICVPKATYSQRMEQPMPREEDDTKPMQRVSLEWDGDLGFGSFAAEDYPAFDLDDLF